MFLFDRFRFAACAGCWTFLLSYQEMPRLGAKLGVLGLASLTLCVVS